MAEQRHNPDKLSDEDWAMSEPEKPVKREIQADQESEAAASLYDPLDTGDLEGWDISSADRSLRGDAGSGQENVETPPYLEIAERQTGEAGMQTGFDVPRHSFEVLKPVPPPNADTEDWSINSSKSKGDDGWKMPEPVFRVSGGQPAKGSERPAGFADEPVAENLIGIYEPPDSLETSGPDAAEFGSERPDAESGEQFELAEEMAIRPSGLDAPAPAKVSSRSGKKWIFIGLGILVFALVAGLITIAAFGLFFFKSK